MLTLRKRKPKTTATKISKVKGEAEISWG